MKCLLKYQWIKLPRNQLPPGKGIMGIWARLASRAAFRSGKATYCGYINEVTVGTWAGGIVGLKSIMGMKRRQQALEMMDRLADLSYIGYTLDPKSKKLTYKITDWVVRCSGEPCTGREAVYVTGGYGFLCLPRNGERIPQPAMDQIERILSEIRILGRNARNKTSSDHAQLCKLVAWYSRTILQQEQTKTGQASAVEGRVAHSDCNNTRAYFSPCKILEYVWEDCQGVTSCMARFEFFHSVLPRAGPVDQDNGGIEHDRFEGIPLW